MPPARAEAAHASHVRRALVGALLGALLAASATVLVLGHPSDLEAPPPRAAPARVPSPAEQAYTQAVAGDCLTWSAADATDLALTDCAGAHRFEVAAAINLGDRPDPPFAPGAVLPGPPLLTQLRDADCAPLVSSYLHTRFDPHGRFTVGLIDPGAAAWRDGVRTVLCGLQQVGPTGEQFAFSGRVTDLDQSDVYPAGTCQNLAAGLPAGPVDCAQPHAAEVISVEDLASKFPGAYPPTVDQDAYLDGVCRSATDTALGAPDAAQQKGLTVFWTTLAAESWAAGSRRVNCKVGKQLPGGGLVPLTGPAR